MTGLDFFIAPTLPRSFICIGSQNLRIIYFFTLLLLGDNALSRYYLRKGWTINQFSIIRPLSEFLIEKVLVERYPELQKLQVSCHAAHKDGDRVKPCGNCEKCRRIVSMLLAVDADPRACGYSTAQIESCLGQLLTKGLHQEAASVAHIQAVLARKCLISLPDQNQKKLKEHPEIEDAAVVGIPDDTWGEIGHAFVIRESGARVGADDIIAFCKQRLTAFKCPQKITFCEEFPRTSLGKVQKRELLVSG